jgi:hypothetical protein
MTQRVEKEHEHDGFLCEDGWRSAGRQTRQQVESISRLIVPSHNSPMSRGGGRNRRKRMRRAAPRRRPSRRQGEAIRPVRSTAATVLSSHLNTDRQTLPPTVPIRTAIRRLSAATPFQKHLPRDPENAMVISSLGQGRRVVGLVNAVGGRPMWVGCRTDRRPAGRTDGQKNSESR